VRAAASCQVEIVDVDEAEFIALGRRNLAQAKLPCLVARNETNVDPTVLEDDLVGEAFGGFGLVFAEVGSVEIDGAIIVAHVE